jgi:hypothetical protein
MVAAACMAVLGLVSAEASASQQVSHGTAARPSIRLQVISTVPLPEQVLETAIGEAAAIWAPYGVTVSATRQLVRPQDSRDEWITLIIRDVSRHEPGHADRHGRRQLAGLAFAGGVPGTLMTASWSVARDMAASTGVPRAAGGDTLAARLLGRALAHEVGHYLLGTRDHAPRGLMRPTFTVRDVLGSDWSSMLLEPAQAARLFDR